MAVIAVYAAGSRAGCFPQIVVSGILEPDGRGMARRTNPCPVGMFREEVPTDILPAVPIATFVKVEKMAVARGTGMAAGRPFAVNLVMAVAAIVPSRGVGVRVGPGIVLVVLRRKRLQAKGYRRIIRCRTCDQIAFFPSGDPRRGLGPAWQAEAAFGVGQH